jgi:hypothetical protein
MLMKNHLSRISDKIGKNIVVARRLKQLPTIIDNLERPALNGRMNNTTRITSMQDIAGCRAIVRNLKQLNELREKLEQSKSVHNVIRVDDYLTPKDSGYGGVHLIYNCFEDSTEQSDWKNVKVEIQLRTDLQHSWATSLEIIDTLEGIKLKTTLDGYPEWRRFFYLSGRLVAHDEQAITLSEQELFDTRHEMVELSIALDVVTKLADYTVAITVADGHKLPKKIKSHQGLFLIEVREIDGKYKATISPFKTKESDLALKALSTADLEGQNKITVLVSAENIRSLRKAYPNYFGSTNKFMKFLTRHTKAEVSLIND